MSSSRLMCTLTDWGLCVLLFLLYTGVSDGCLIGIASRCCSRVDVYAQRGDDTWGSEGSEFIGIRPTAPSLIFLKANILIDEDGHARLADFGLTMIISDPAHATISNFSKAGGTIRWMSPERFDPIRFGVRDGRPTRESDCYALGMVILEVLSGEVPFGCDCTELMVMHKVVEGGRPGRPGGAEGMWFTDELWGTLKMCWLPQPRNRPTIGAVSECLKRVSTDRQQLLPRAGGSSQIGTNDGFHSTVNKGVPLPASPPNNPPTLAPSEAKDFVEVFDRVRPSAGSRSTC